MKKKTAVQTGVASDTAATFRPHGLTLQDWQKDLERRKALEAVLSSSVLREAVQTLSETFRPVCPPGVAVPPVACPADIAGLEKAFALKYAHSSGFYAFWRSLHSLLLEGKPVAQQQVPFGDMLPEQP